MPYGCVLSLLVVRVGEEMEGGGSIYETPPKLIVGENPDFVRMVSKGYVKHTLCFKLIDILIMHVVSLFLNYCIALLSRFVASYYLSLKAN